MAGFDRFDRAEREAGNLGIVFRAPSAFCPRRLVHAPFSLDCSPLLLFLFARDCVLPLARAHARKALLGKGIKSAVNGYVRCFSV